MFPDSHLLLNPFDLGKGSEKKRIFYGLLPNPPLGPPGMVFLRIKKLPLFFLSKIKSQMGKTNFTFSPIPKSYFLFFDSDLLFPRIRASQASFKVVLIAVYMTNGLQTKCKTCFGGPRKILDAL